MTAGTRVRFLPLAAATVLVASAAWLAAPAVGAPGDGGTETPSPAAAGQTAPSGPAEGDLSLAVQRDLGLSPAEFSAAGQLGAGASAVQAELRNVPGFAAVQLVDGRIVVSGEGPELAAAVAGLAGEAPVDLAVEPGTQVTAGPAADDVPADDAPDAPAAGSETAASAEQLFQDYLSQVGPEGLQAVVASGHGFVIRTGGINRPEAEDAGAADYEPSRSGNVAGSAEAKVSPARFVSRFSNVRLDDGPPLAAEADVPGGTGYFTDQGVTCSTGFAVFTPAGLPAVLTAGHCSTDGAARTATLEPGTPNAGPLGTFGFSQFGGPGNSRIVEDPDDAGNPGNVGADISVVAGIQAGLDPSPAANTWGDASVPGPDVKIIGQANPVVGMPVCRSGRTSAWSCGTVDEVGIFVVPGPSSGSDAGDLRAFRGFLSYGVQSSGGDSGGPYLSGNYAVGTHSAGDAPDADGAVVRNFAVASTLANNLQVLPGYGLEVFLNKPAVTEPAAGATYTAGQPVTGTVPAAPASAVAAGSAVRITVRGQSPIDVPVNAGGNWSFDVPTGFTGKLQFTAETVNGFSTSGPASFSFASAPVVPAKPAVPAEPAAPVKPAPVPAKPASPVESTPDPLPIVVVPAVADPVTADPTGAAGDPAAVNLPPSETPANLAITGIGGNAATPGHTAVALANTGAGAVGGMLWIGLAAGMAGAFLLVLVRRGRKQGAR